MSVSRGPLVDTLHRGDIAVAGSDGRVLYSVGDRRKLAFWRSAAKPFQAVAFVTEGVSRRWTLGAEEIALLCGSPGGEPAHVTLLERLRGRVGLDTTRLRCGGQLPIHSASATEHVRSGLPLSAIHNECSGQHLGMLALALICEADLDTYTESAHPVQQHLLRAVAELSGVRTTDVVLGIDGCTAPTYGLSVDRMAIAYARLLDPSALPTEYAEPARQVVASWIRHPFFAAGSGRFDSDAMTAIPGLVMKGGSEGILCAGLSAEVPRAAHVPRGALGIAIKIEDGGGLTPRQVAMSEVLRQLGVLDREAEARLSPYVRPVVRDNAGTVAGFASAVFRLGEVLDVIGDR